MDAVFNYTFGWDYVMKNGILYGSIKDEGLTFSTGRSFYKLENLFNGDETLGELKFVILYSGLDYKCICRRSNE